MLLYSKHCANLLQCNNKMPKKGQNCYIFNSYLGNKYAGYSRFFTFKITTILIANFSENYAPSQRSNGCCPFLQLSATNIGQ